MPLWRHMATLNSGFLSTAHYMDDTAAAGLSMAATANTTKTYLGTPGTPTGGYRVDRGLRFGIQGVWTGTASPVGTLNLQASNDNSNWTTISGTSQAVSGAGNFLWAGTCDWAYLRLAYTRTSGGATDTLVATIKVTGSAMVGG